MKHADLIDDGGPSLHSLPKEMQQTSAAISSGGLRLLRITKDSYSRDQVNPISVDVSIPQMLTDLV